MAPNEIVASPNFFLEMQFSPLISGSQILAPTSHKPHNSWPYAINSVIVSNQGSTEIMNP